MKDFIEKLKLKLIKLAEYTHLKFFGHEMSDTMRKFLQNLSWSFIGIGINSVMLFGAMILIGRALGPYEFGKYNLVLSIAMVLNIFMLAGFNVSAVKFISSTKDILKKNIYLSNALIAVLITGSIVAVSTLIMRSFIAKQLGIGTGIVVVAVLFAVVTSLKLLFDDFTKGFQKFNIQAGAKSLEGIIVLSIVAILFYFGNNTYIIFLVPATIASVVIIFIYAKHFKRNIVKWNKKHFTSIQGYLKLTILVSVIGISISTVDKFFIARFLSMEDLGLYSAYLMASITIVGQVSLVLSNVFFPMVTSVGNQVFLIKKIDKIFIYTSIPMALMIAVFTIIILKLLGNKYEIDMSYVILVSIIGPLQVLISFYGSITASSESILKIATRFYRYKPLFLGVIYSGVYFMHLFNLKVLFIIMIISYLYDIINTKVSVFLSQKNNNL